MPGGSFDGINSTEASAIGSPVFALMTIPDNDAAEPTQVIKKKAAGTTSSDRIVFPV